MSKLTRDRLKCPFCPSTRFHRVVHITWSANSGTADEPAGLRCVDCGADVDVHKMIERKQLDEKKRELDALRAEIDETAEPEKAPKPAAAGKGK